MSHPADMSLPKSGRLPDQLARVVSGQRASRLDRETVRSPGRPGWPHAERCSPPARGSAR
ncbi:hypothetical protein [Kibdelosporangium philippinense]|uniref:hypothetical protein n=1 Tax=Kibdelosporangium philippinense TaxID=211113 RepID=UPI00361BC8E2